ncbi:MAG TPA: hypothetical protein ENH49_00315 [Candidatus Marinimicrobia bacterium]|nr:hypothetical protein [Candidatus Neomarinimicrobiota bacterium]
MDRYQFEDLISDYIENNLSMSQRKEFESYQENHPNAKEQVESIKQLMGSMKSMPVVETSKSFGDNLYKRIALEKEAKSVVKTTRSFAGYTPLMAGLSAVVVIAVVVLGLEFMPVNTNQAGFQPYMAEGTELNIPDNNGLSQDKLLAEADDDSTEIDATNQQKHDFENQIRLVGDKRP